MPLLIARRGSALCRSPWTPCRRAGRWRDFPVHPPAELIQRFEALDRAQEREERMLREEAARSREESARAAKAQREELNEALQKARETESQIDLRDRDHLEGPARNRRRADREADRVECRASRKSALRGRSAPEATAGRQLAADRKDARDGRREVAGHAGETARRIIPNGERAAGSECTRGSARCSNWRATSADCSASSRM